MVDQGIDYQRYYRFWHPDTPEHAEAMSAYYTRILSRHLPADKQTALLDIGCGMGFALLTLRRLGYSCLRGVDIDQRQVDSCRDKGLDVVRSTDLIEFLGGGPKYGVILALDVLEHVPVADQVPVVRAIHAALLPGGSFICTVPNANSALASRWRYIDWTHCTSFTEHSLDFLLHNGGFGRIAIEPIEFVCRPRLLFVLRRGVLQYFLFRFFRLVRRLQMIAELGKQGKTVPLSLNLLARAIKA